MLLLYAQGFRSRILEGEPEETQQTKEKTMPKQAQQAAEVANALGIWRALCEARYAPTPTVAALVYARHTREVAKLPVA